MTDEEKSKAAREKRQGIKVLTLFTQISLSALCPIFLLTMAGIRLDEKFGGGAHWYTLAGVLIGVYSAYRNTYLLIRDTMGDKDEKPKSDGNTDKT